VSVELFVNVTLAPAVTVIVLNEPLQKATVLAAGVGHEEVLVCAELAASVGDAVANKVDEVSGVVVAIRSVALSVGVAVATVVLSDILSVLLPAIEYHIAPITTTTIITARIIGNVNDFFCSIDTPFVSLL